MNKFRGIMRELGEIDKRANAVEKMEFNLTGLKSSEKDVVRGFAQHLSGENVCFEVRGERVTVTFGMMASMKNRLANSSSSNAEKKEDKRKSYLIGEEKPTTNEPVNSTAKAGTFERNKVNNSRYNAYVFEAAITLMQKHIELASIKLDEQIMVERLPIGKAALDILSNMTLPCISDGKVHVTMISRDDKDENAFVFTRIMNESDYISEIKEDIKRFIKHLDFDKHTNSGLHHLFIKLPTEINLEKAANEIFTPFAGDAFDQTKHVMCSSSTIYSILWVSVKSL